MILAIDPGSEQSGYVVWDTTVCPICDKGIVDNDTMRDVIAASVTVDVCAIEWPRGMGQTAGNELLDTAIWTGKFAAYAEMAGMRVVPVSRRDVKMHLVGAMTAKDQNIREALIERYGQPGTKKSPGILYGISSHLWAALAVAVVCADKGVL